MMNRENWPRREAQGKNGVVRSRCNEVKQMDAIEIGHSEDDKRECVVE